MDEPTMDQASPTRLRALNRISVLLPARRYKLNCAWTYERPLPAIDELTCRLLLVLGRIEVAALRLYLGLSEREVEILVDSLVSSRLVDFDVEGRLQPAPLLATKFSSDPNLIPSLTKYETNDELVVFDLLTLQLLPRRNAEERFYGLPEIPVPTGLDVNIDDKIIEEFGRQYRSHLEATRRSPREQQATLYKVGSCELDRVMQIPVDLEVHLEPQTGDHPKVTRDAVERLGETQFRSLSVALETKVSEYLGSLKVPDCELSFTQFCTLFEDDILGKYARPSGFDFSAWLVDRQARKTGYGTPSTIGLVGPIYSRENRVLLQRILRGSLGEAGEPGPREAFWRPSSAPLWGASGLELAEFVRKIEDALFWRKKGAPKNRKQHGALIALFSSESSWEDRNILTRFKGRLHYAMALRGPVLLDKVEMLVVRDVLAIAQYHVQPDPASAISVPIGFVTTDLDRITRVTKVLRSRCIRTTNVSTLWAPDRAEVVSLDWLVTGSEPKTVYLVNTDPATGEKSLIKKATAITPPAGKPKLTLKKPK